MWEQIFELLGLLTFVLGSICAIISFILAIFFANSDSVLGRDLKHKMFADGCHMLMTTCFGLSMLIDAPEFFWRSTFAIRVFLLLYVLWALIRFFNHVKLLKDNAEKG